ncbi:hypothetical protein [Photorhabdus heterorhabditis]|uniref:hypothetical protein n=1 Tax=Photorhabdus heterorhabditis TaxID=880156 RepID=UPI001BD6089E|nr:hypothetical protein [Photorhabdus heterorhabditis]MBS9441253.1 hypothetical protein [Photorhabdus heterorhabditis]
MAIVRRQQVIPRIFESGGQTVNEENDFWEAVKNSAAQRTARNLHWHMVQGWKLSSLNKLQGHRRSYLPTLQKKPFTGLTTEKIHARLACQTAVVGCNVPKPVYLPRAPA